MTDPMNAPTAASQLVDSLLRSFPDFPKAGIVFRDLSAVLADGAAFGAVVDALLEGFAGDVTEIDLVAGVEARGFLLAGAAARSLRCGVLPIRKAGKLPGPVIAESYDLEYGKATLELIPPAERDGRRVLLLDDVLATGGTLDAAATLLERCGYVVAGIGVVLELSSLGGANRLSRYPVSTVTTI